MICAHVAEMKCNPSVQQIEFERVSPCNDYIVRYDVQDWRLSSRLASLWWPKTCPTLLSSMPTTWVTEICRATTPGRPTKLPASTKWPERGSGSRTPTVLRLFVRPRVTGSTQDSRFAELVEVPARLRGRVDPAISNQANSRLPIW